MHRLVAILLLLPALPARAGEPERLGVPVATASYFNLGTMSLKGGADLSNLQTFRVRGMAGGRLKRAGLILSGGADYALWLMGEELDRTLHAVNLRLAAIKTVRGPWGIMAFLRLGGASDMKGSGWEDLRTAVGAGVSYMPSKNLRLQVGVTYSNNLFGELVLPLVNLAYRKGPISLNLNLPRGGNIWWAIHRKVEMGINLEALTIRAALHLPDRTSDELALLSVLLDSGIRIYFYRGIFAAAEGGYTVRYAEHQLRGQTIKSDVVWEGGYGGVSVGYMY